jgi:hypothetical protein
MPKRAKIVLRPQAPAARPSPVATPPTRTARPASREGTKMIGGHFPEATWAQLSHLGTDLRKTQQELLGEALDDLFVKYSRT